MTLYWQLMKSVGAVIEERAFSGWVYVSKAESILGCWVAHCLDFNVISQGDSPSHALEMVREALGMALADDLRQGLDPDLRRKECDADDWAPLHRLLQKHTKVPVRDIDGMTDSFKEFAMPITLMFVQRAELEAKLAVEVNEVDSRAA